MRRVSGFWQCPPLTLAQNNALRLPGRHHTAFRDIAFLAVGPARERSRSAGVQYGSLGHRSLGGRRILGHGTNKRGRETPDPFSTTEWCHRIATFGNSGGGSTGLILKDTS